MGLHSHHNNRLHTTMTIFYKLTRIFKRVILPILILFYLSLIFFNLHTKNFYNNQINSSKIKSYQGGLIDDIKVIKCMSLLYGECNQIIEVDPFGQEKVWIKVDKYLDLNGKPQNRFKNSSFGFTSLWDTLFCSVRNHYHEYLYVHLYNPTQHQFNYAGKVIIDIAFGDPESQTAPYYIIKEAQSMLGKAKSRFDTESIYNNWDLKADGIWVKYDRASNEQVEPVNDITYFIGDDDMIEPRDNWRLAYGKLAFRDLKVSIHKGSYDQPDTSSKIIQVKNEQGGFKILQVSDLHFSSSFGKCNDQFRDRELKCRADTKTLQFLHRVLDLESPDLVIITGDLIDGVKVEDYQTALLKALSPFISRKIPYAISLGFNDVHNHASRSEIIKFINSLPYSILNDSETNYMVQITNQQGQCRNALYILDLFQETPNQLQILKSLYESLPNKPKHSLLFQHAPIKEFRPKGTFGIVGVYNEKGRLPAKLTDPKTIDFISEANIQLVSVGYEHTNDCCIQASATNEAQTNPWLCFSGAVGEAGYGKGSGSNAAMDRRVRFFEIDEYQNIITSWKRRQGDGGDGVFDYQYIYHES